MTHVLLPIVLACSILSPQDPARGDGLAPYREMLDDLDRDEARELAMRCLVTRPESPAGALTAWAKADGGKRWWRRLTLVRVLGERGELTTAMLEKAMVDERWPVRLAAMRVTGLPPGRLSTPDKVARLLQDDFVLVRRECLRALARRHELSDDLYVSLLESPGFSKDLIAIYLARPAAFGPKVLRRLLARPKQAQQVLSGLPGRRLGASEVVLHDYVRGKAPAGLRCLALTALPRRSWQSPVMPLVQQALQEDPIRDEALWALSVQLHQTEKAVLMKGAASDTREDRFLLRLRMAKGLVLEPPLREVLLGELDTCAADRIEPLVRWFEESGDPASQRGWKTRLLVRLDKSKDDELSRMILAALSPHADPAHPEIAQRFVARLAQVGPLSELAFRSLQDASYVPARVDFARRDVERLALHARQLLRQADRVDAAFWLELLASEDRTLRWIATQGLKGRSDQPAIRKQLLRVAADEKDEGVLSGLLQSLLHGADADTAMSLTRSVIDKKLDSLDDTLVTLLETARRPRLDSVLDLLDTSRLARRSLLVRAFRWQVPAIRKVLLQPEQFSESDLRKLRKRLARVLGKADLPLLSRYLLGEGGAKAAPFVRTEVVEWLRLRRDLEAGSLIERAYEAESRMEIKEGLCAALVERGRVNLLEPLVDKWMLHEDEEAFGLLFEVLGALRGKVGREQCRFLMRLFLAPMIRDPLAAIRKEHDQRTLRARLGVLYPMLQPVVERLVQADEKLIEEVLLEELRNPKLREAFAAMSKSYLLRALYVAGGYEGGVEAMRPLLALARHAVPRPHEADGAFSLLEAEILAHQGAYAEAIANFRRGLLQLSLADWSPRLIEYLVSSLYRETEAFGSGVLRARLALLEARQALSQKNLQKGGEAAERARLAIAPHGFGARETLFLQKLAGQAGDRGR